VGQRTDPFQIKETGDAFDRMKWTKYRVDIIFAFRFIFQIEDIDFYLFDVFKAFRNEIPSEGLILNLQGFFRDGFS